MAPLPFPDNPLRTRADVQQLVRHLVTPLIPHFSPGRAEVHLGANRGLSGDPACLLEAFARPLWGLVPLAAGGGGFEHWALWQEGITSGTTPSHSEYWGEPGDWDQRSVEQAAFGFGLALAPRPLWESLPPEVRRNLASWLQRINEVQLVQSNWLYFRVLVNLGLRQRGETWSEERVETDLVRLDQFYLGGGWYSDGEVTSHFRDGRLGDYYVPMAFHYYGLVYARLASADDPARAARFAERARHFARDFVHWFAEDGAALPFGRSLAYRFAQGAFWGALAFAGVEALPWPVVKGLYLRHLRWWMRQPIFSETGLLTVGYAYPNLLMAESYNSPGSPYWALKTFLPLALGDEHPFWRAEEASLPPRRAVHTVPGAKLVLMTDPRSRDVTALSPGQPVLEWPRHAPHKYSKCSYSTRFAFCVPASVATPSEGGLDNGLSLSDDGRFFRVREHCLDAEVRDGVAYSRHLPWPEVEVRTWLLADAAGHVRIHQIKTPRRLWTFEGGFPVGYTARGSFTLQPEAPNGCVVRTPLGAATLRSLLPGRQGEGVNIGANSPLMTSLAVMPALRSVIEPGEHWLACWVGGSRDRGDAFTDAGQFSASIDENGCQIRRNGRPWWTSSRGGTAGESSTERLRALETFA
jgi:hypothetical protein